jgi:[acyl-carrier-protein] S-malonyltransferase
MGKDAAAVYPRAREAYEVADRALGFSISRLCFEGPDEDLRLTEKTQPAILATSAALFAVLRAEGARPDVVAGHSLGEYSALVAAGALDLDEAVRIVRNRGRYMQEAVPVGVGAMAAVLGLPAPDVALLCHEASQGQVVEPANLNGGGQVAIAGHREAVDRAMALALSRGAKRAIPLAVSAPFHCRLMEPAAARLAQDLASVEFSDLEVPLFTNVDASPITTGGEARDALVRQVASPVRWEEIIESMLSSGVTRFVEVGPGKVLAGLVRKIDRSVKASSVGTPEEIDRFLTESSVV